LENELTSSDTVISVSVVSVAELEGFLRRNNYSEAKLQKLERMLAKVSIISISNDDEELIEAFATLQNYSKNLHPTAKLGRSVGIGQNDLWIMEPKSSDLDISSLLCFENLASLLPETE
jgi:predicted nucleic acid-binding protein